MVEWNLKNKSGQSLIEILIAMAVGIITILAAVTVLTLMLRIGKQDVSFQTAAFMEQEVIDNLLVTSERDWQEVAETSEDKKYYLKATETKGVFEIIEGSKTVAIDAVDYTYYLEIDPVNRDSSGAIASSGTDDPSTKKVELSVTWKFQGDDEISTVTKYITRSKNEVFRQTNWSGGPTKTSDETIPDITHRFYESTGLDFVAQPGLLKVEGIE
jgi:type II secretory pathway pseudopilin PulG